MSRDDAPKKPGEEPPCGISSNIREDEERREESCPHPLLQRWRGMLGEDRRLEVAESIHDGPRSRFVGPKASLQHKLQDTRRRSGPPMVSFLPIFAKPPLTLKTNGHQQAAVEPDLESLLLAAAKPPRCAMNHGAQKELPLSLSLNLGDQEGGVSLSGSPALSLNKHPEDGSGEDVVGI